MKTLILSLLVLSFTSQAWSQKGTGPYDRESNANIAQKIIHVLDNSTVGAVQTVLGATHILVYGILNPIKSEHFGLSTHNNAKSEVSQIVVETPAINAGAYSLGLFQVGDYAHNHEGGHSVASAALGPLYLPMIGLSYLLEGHNRSFFEKWADMEADPEPYMNTASAQVGLGSIMLNGQNTNFVVFKFNLEQRQVQRLGGHQNPNRNTNRYIDRASDREYDSPGKIESDKVFQWINTKIVAPLLQGQASDQLPLLVEIDLLKKSLNVLVDDLDVYLGADQYLRNSIQTEQKYLHIENNPALKQVHIKALDWSAKYGLQYNLGNIIAVTPRIGIGASLGVISDAGTDYKTFMFQDKYNFAASFKFNAGIDIKIWNYATLTGEYEREMYSTGQTRSSWSAQLHNEFRDPFKNIGFVQSLDFGTGYRSDTWQMGTEKTTVNQWNATLGFKF